VSDRESSNFGPEEERFATLLSTGMDPVAAAFASDLVAPGTSPAIAKKTAMQALGDSDVKAFIIDAAERNGVTIDRAMATLGRNLDTHKYGIHQASGDVVDLGDDGMTQISAVKLLFQATGVLGGGAQNKPVDQATPPVAIQVVFPVRNIRDDESPEVIINGDTSYSVSS